MGHPLFRNGATCRVHGKQSSIVYCNSISISHIYPIWYHFLPISLNIYLSYRSRKKHSVSGIFLYTMMTFIISWLETYLGKGPLGMNRFLYKGKRPYHRHIDSTDKNLYLNTSKGYYFVFQYSESISTYKLA